MPYFRLIQHFDLAPHISNSILLTEAYYSITIMDNKNLRSIIKEYAGRILDNGPSKITEKAICIYRRRLFDVMNNTRYSHDNVERIIGVYRLKIILSDIIIRMERKWSARQDHWLYRRLKDCESPIAQALVDAICNEEDSALFLVSERVLADLGGPPNDGFKVKIM